MAKFPKTVFLTTNSDFDNESLKGGDFLHGMDVYQNAEGFDNDTLVAEYKLVRVGQVVGELKPAPKDYEI